MSRAIVIESDDERESRLLEALHDLIGGPPQTEPPPTGSPSGPTPTPTPTPRPWNYWKDGPDAQPWHTWPTPTPVASPSGPPLAGGASDSQRPVALSRPAGGRRGGIPLAGDTEPLPLQDYNPNPPVAESTPTVEPVVDWSKAAPDPSWVDRMAERWAAALVDAMAEQPVPVARVKAKANSEQDDFFDKLMAGEDPWAVESPTYGFAPQEGASKADAAATGGGSRYKLADLDGASKAEALKGSGGIPDTNTFALPFKAKAGFPMAARVADTPVVYQPGVDPALQAELGAQGEAQKKKEQEERDAASRKQGNTVYGYGNLGRSLAAGGMNSGTGIAQGLAQLNNAGTLGTMAAGFGPAVMGLGAAVDAGTQMIAGAFRGMKQMADEGGKAIKQIASNDGFGLLQTGVEMTAKSFEKLPLVGGMVADGLRALVAPVGLFKTAMEAFSGRAKELSGLDPRIATAQAVTDMRRQFADLREAQQMGGRYAKLVEQQERLERTLTDLLMPIKEVVADTLSDVADLLRAILPAAQTGAEAAEGSRSLIAVAVDFYSGFAPGLKDLLARARANRQSEADAATASALGELEDLLRGLPPLPAPMPAGNGGWARPPAQVPVVLNPPR